MVYVTTNHHTGYEVPCNEYISVNLSSWKLKKANGVEASWSKMEKNWKSDQNLKSFSNNCPHMANIILNLYYIQSEFSKICMGQMEAFLLFMPFWYSASWPFFISRQVLHALCFLSLFVLSKSACLPLKPPLLPVLWCKSGRRQWVLTCQLSWLPEGWLWAGTC